MRRMDHDKRARLEKFAETAPITYEMVCDVWGTDKIDLNSDSDRAAFFAVWALLRYDYAEAMIDMADERSAVDYG